MVRAAADGASMVAAATSSPLRPAQPASSAPADAISVLDSHFRRVSTQPQQYMLASTPLSAERRTGPRGTGSMSISVPPATDRVRADPRRRDARHAPSTRRD